MAASTQSRSNADRQLYLIDAMALAYRSHFVFISRPLINSKGQNTSATYGFTNALLKLIEDHEMAHMAVVFDAEGEGAGFRDEIYEEYKANRSPIPEELVENLPYMKQLVEAMDIPVLEVPGVEADDVIGTLARRAEAEGADVVIVSPDKDFQQLLSPRISIFKPARSGQEFDPITADSFREKFSLEPEQFIDILALMGDTSDNVPGVPGIGEKTAMKLLQEYDSVEVLLEHAEDVKGKRAREGLLEHSEDALLSKRLVTIKTDLDLTIDWHRFHRAQPKWAEIARLFDELEFRGLLKKTEQGDLFSDTRPAFEETSDGKPVFADDELGQYDASEVDYRLVRNRHELDAFAAELAQHAVFAFDTETTSVEPMWASLVGMSFSWKEGDAWYVPTPLPDGTPTDDVLAVLGPLMKGRIIGQNLKYDLIVMARHGVTIEAELFDTMVAHYLIAPEEPHNLDVLVRKYLGYRMVPISDLIGSGKDQKSMRDVPIDETAPYACEDADMALRLATVLSKELVENGLDTIAHDVEFPLILVLRDVEIEGVGIDVAMLQEISEQLDTQMKILEHEIYELAGESFNINSTQQLGDILFTRLGLSIVSKTSTGKPSTKESVLERLTTEHPLPGMILDWRKIAKLKSTYVDNLPGLVHPETGRIHTSYNQTVTATGRLSSSNPNLQNIPVRSAMGREIRKAFVARPGHKLIAADYVQIELRILASMSGDEALKRAFADGQDIHTSTAARVYDVDEAEVTRDQRRKAKEVNYGIPYGVSPWGLAQRLRTSAHEAQALITQYRQSYPKVARFLADTVDGAKQKGYVVTMLGRRRFVPNINSRNRTQRSFAERVAVNMPIQGSQADMTKIAMVRLHRRLRDEGFRTRMLMQVHDELVLEAPADEVERVKPIIEAEMVQALPLDVPVEVDMDVGDNWLDAH